MATKRNIEIEYCIPDGEMEYKPFTYSGGYEDGLKRAKSVAEIQFSRGVWEYAAIRYSKLKTPEDKTQYWEFKKT
jgi:hypothetical protein